MIRDVLRMGDPRLLRALARRSSASARPSSTRCSPTCATRWRAQNGAGLAAPQIGVPLRVVIFGIEHNPRYPDAEPVPYTELINPVLTPLADEIEEGWEGCLSVPGLARRRAALHAPALRGLRSARAGRSSARSSGFHARVVQHECDHLDGILYPMRMRDMRALRLHRHPVPGCATTKTSAAA